MSIGLSYTGNSLSFEQQVAQGQNEIDAIGRLRNSIQTLAQQESDFGQIRQALLKMHGDMDGQVINDFMDAVEARVAQILQAASRPQGSRLKLQTIRAATQRAIEEVSDELEAAVINAQRVRYLDEAKRLQVLSEIDELSKLCAQGGSNEDTDALAACDREAFAALLLGSPKVAGAAGRGSGLSIDGTFKLLRLEYVAALYSRMNDLDCWQAFGEAENARAIYNAVIDLAQGDDANRQAAQRYVLQVRQIAQVLVALHKTVRTAKNAEGAMLNEQDDFKVPLTHNAIRMKQAGFAVWRDYVLPRLDMAQTFAGQTHVEIEQLLRQIYGELTTGQHERVSYGLASEALAKDQLHFKDGDAQFEYAREFGYESLMASYFYFLESSAQEIALMQRLGSNPEAMLQSVIDAHMNQLAGDPVRAMAFMNSRKAVMDMLGCIDGSMRRFSGDSSVARWGRSVQAFDAMQRLGRSTLPVACDVPIMAGALHGEDGAGYLDKVSSNLVGDIKYQKETEKKLLLDSLQHINQSIMGEIAQQFDAPDLPAGAMAKGMLYFLKYRGLFTYEQSVNHVLQLELQAMFGRRGQTQSYADLPLMLRKLMTAYGITELKWGVLKHAVLPGANGRVFMTPQAIKSIPDFIILQYLADQGESPSSKTVSEVKQELEIRYRAMVAQAMKATVALPLKEPGVTVPWGTLAGTAEHEIANYIITFQSFPLAMLQNVLGRDAFSKEMEEFEGLLAYGNSSLVQIAGFVAGATVLGHIANLAKDMLAESDKSKAEEIPSEEPLTEEVEELSGEEISEEENQDERQIETWIDALLQGGGARFLWGLSFQ